MPAEDENLERQHQSLQSQNQGVYQRESIERRIEDLRAEFESLAGASADTVWRGAVGNPTRLLIESARLADLIVTASPEAPLLVTFIVPPTSAT